MPRQLTFRTLLALAFTTILVAVPLAVRSQSSPRPMSATETEVDKMLRATMTAWATLDPTKAAPFYAKDADLVFFDVTPLAYSGWAEYEAGTKAAFAAFSALTVTLNRDLRVRAKGNNGWATATLNMDVTMKDGTKMQFDARWTAIVEKRGENWLIVHEHVSAPLTVPGMEEPAKKG